MPKAGSYPGWVPDDDGARDRYDLSVAIAEEALQEAPHSAAARMAAEIIYGMPCPTR